MFSLNRLSFPKFFQFCLYFSALLLPALVSATPQPKFTQIPAPLTRLPYFTLKWDIENPSEGAAEVLFEIEKSTKKDFSDATTYYKGSDRQSFVAGLGEGQYYFRIRRLEEGDVSKTVFWSDSFTVEILYESLTKALILFGLGGIVSLATIVMVFTGDRKLRREEAAYH